MAELQESVGWAAEASIRGAVAGLREVGALERRRLSGARNAVMTHLTAAGEEMLLVADVLERWLAACPQGPIPIDGPKVKVAVKALAEGWTSTLMRVLASEPLTLTELSTRIPEVSYPALERRLAWMRTTGQVTALEKEARGTPYVPTDWLRQAISPLAVAGRCERRHMEDAPPISDVEVETAFLLSLPLVRLADGMEGSCTLASQTDPLELDERRPHLAGVAVTVADGEIASSTITLDDEPTSWAIGSPDDWLEAVIEGRLEILRVGGAHPQLAIDLVNGLHVSLTIDR